jgi:VWFA-related protein
VKLGLLLAAAVLAQDPVIRSTVVNVQVSVTVVDKKGRHVSGLTADDFELFDSGLPQKAQVDDVTAPISMVVAVQTNTNARDVLNVVRKSAALLQDLVVGDAGEIAVVAFDHEVTPLCDFTSDSAELTAAFAKLKSRGGPHHLDDAAMQGVRMLQTRAKDRKKVLLLIGEGFDQGSAVGPADVFSQAELNGVLIYAVKMKPANPETPMKAKNPVPAEQRGSAPMGTIRTMTSDVQTNGYGPSLTDAINVFRGLMADSNLGAYAQFTGARAEDFSNQKTLDAALVAIGRELHSQYLLTFAPSRGAAGYHELTARVRKPDLKVRLRRGYWAAP